MPAEGPMPLDDKIDDLFVGTQSSIGHMKNEELS